MIKYFINYGGSNLIKDYLPIITVILTGVLTYLFGFRKGKIEKFHSRLEESLGDIITPLLHDVKIIQREEDTFRKEELIKAFFLRYSNVDSKLYKLSSKFMIDWYYITEEYFYIFLKSRLDEDWRNFWVYFINLLGMIQEEFNDIRGILFADFRWQMGINKKSIFMKIAYEVLVLIYELIKFVIFIVSVFIFGCIIDSIEGKKLIPIDIKKFSILILLLLLVVFGILFAILSQYVTSLQMQKTNTLKKLLEKIFPKFYKKWDKFISIDLEKERKKINIPPMHK